MNRDKLRLVISMLIFGTIGVVRRHIDLPSSAVALARAGIGLIFLLIVKLVRRERFDKAVIRRNLMPLLMSGSFLGFNWILLFEAYSKTSVSCATICYYMAPVIIILLSPVLFREKLTMKKIICVLISVIGMVMVSGVVKSGVSGLGGVALALGAAAMYAAIVVINKRVEGLSGIDRTVIQFAVSVICLIPYVTLTEDVSSLSVNGLSLVMLIIAGIVQTGFAYVLYFGSLAVIPAQTSSILSYIDPISAVLFSIFLLGEPMDALSIIGAVLAIGAMLFNEIDFRAAPRNTAGADAERK